MPPQHFGRYRVVRPLGEGGMGTVWLAHDDELNRDVAVKLVQGGEAASEHARAQLLREARAAAALSHQNIAVVHDVLDVGGQIAIVFEFADGETLAARLARGPVRPHTAVAIGVELARALCAAHEHGVVHRDLKPANIVLTREGGVKVLDFGVARVLPQAASGETEARTTAGGFVGTVGYAAPEQCLGQHADARADIFSLGVVLFELVTGRRPFPGADATTVVRAMLESEAPRAAALAPGVPPELDGLIARMLATDAARRPATARQVCDVLESLQAAPAPAPRPPRPSPWRRRWAVATVLIVALATGGLVSSLLRSEPAPVVTHDRPPVVAVLPLANASGDESKDYLAVGFADSLVTRVAALPSVTVLSRAAVADARARHADFASVAADLDATYLVDGSVQEITDRLRVTLTLLRRDASVAWAETVEGPSAGVFHLQARLAAALAAALSVQLSAADRATLAEQPTTNADALAAYWRGRALLERRDVEGHIDLALAALDEAIRLDPHFASAFAARGEALWLVYNNTRDPAAAKNAVEAGLTALRIDPGRPEVRYSVALALRGRGDLEGAVQELQRALALRPNYDDARRELGNVLAQQGRMAEAIVEFEKAIAVRPNYWAHHHALGTAHLRNAQYLPAADAFQKVLSLQPDNASAHQNLGVAYHFLGRLEEALAAYQRANALRPSALTYSNMGAIHHRRGEYEQAVAAYRAALKLRPNFPATHRNLGDAFRRLGRRGDARRAYEEAVRLTRAALEVNPRDAEALASLAVYRAKLGEWEEARASLQEALDLGPSNVQVLYRAAVVRALAADYDGALQALEAAVASGYSRSEIAEDDDLAPLRDAPRFRAILGASAMPGEER